MKKNLLLQKHHMQRRLQLLSQSDGGQALITLLFFMIVMITITSSAVVITLINSVSASKFAQAEEAYMVAESGAENALVRLLRDPAYTGESMNVSSGSATIQVTPAGNSYTILSTGTVGNFVRKIRVTTSYSNGKMTITSWKEVHQ